MLSAKDVSIHFVVDDGGEENLSDEIKKAFQDCKEAGLKPQFISDDAVKELDKTNKVIVIEKFEGRLFEYLKKQKFFVCGPKCLQICLAEKQPIPENNSPVFMTAMRDLVVSASNIPAQFKSKVREKILYMGGKYSHNLVESVTHLVTGGVQSKKYQKAVEKGISIMTVEWVDAVWNEGIKRNVHATNSQFNKYKCPIFLDLIVTVSNMPLSDKEKIKRLINSNGGTYSKEMKRHETCLLIISNVKNSQKFSFAQSWEMPCVSPSWVYESVEKGYALPIDDYIMKPTVHSSTPTKDDHERPSFGANDISVVSGTCLSNQSALTCNEATLLSNRGTQKSAVKLKVSGNDTFKKDIDKLNIGEAKRAGAFLEGCKVYLSGFKAEEQDKLRRILTLGGAVVFMEISDAVSHVICGEFVAADMKAVSKSANRPFLVTVGWLVASVKEKTAVPEEVYCNVRSEVSLDPEPPSPLSQKGMKLLKKNDTRSPDQAKELPKDNSPEAHTMVNRKLFDDLQQDEPPEDQNNRQPDPVSVVEIMDDVENENNEATTTESPIFKGLAFLILEYEESTAEIIENMIKENGGKVVTQNFKGVTDYTIVPIDGATGHLQLQSTVVTHLWLEECIQENRMSPVLYYHEPISISDGFAPLEGCVITITTYANKERLFLDLLVEALGAVSQDMFSRKDNEAKGVKACTHLVSPSAGSQKYFAALKWNIPVVTKDWLLNCARLGTKLPEAPYSVPAEDQKKIMEPQTVSSAQGTGNTSNNCHVKDTPRPKEDKRTSIVPALSCKPDNTKVSTSQSNPLQKVSLASHVESGKVNEETPKRCLRSSNENQSIDNKFVTPDPSSNVQMNQTPSNGFSGKKSKKSGLTPDNEHQESNDGNKTSSASRNLQSNQSPSNSFHDNKSRESPEKTNGNQGPSGNYKTSLPSTSFQNQQTPTNLVRKSSGMTPGYKLPSEMKTPDTPYEKIYPHSCAGKQARKRVKHCIDKFSQNAPHLASPKKRKLSTPLSELMKRAFDKFGLTPDSSFVNSDNVTESNAMNDGADCVNNRTQRTSLIGSSNLDQQKDTTENEPEIDKDSNSSKNSGKTPSGSEFLDVLNEKLQNLTPACQEVKRWIPDTTDQIVSSRNSNESKAQAQKACASWDCESQPIDVGWQEPVEERERARELGMSKERKFAFSNVNNEKKENYESIIKNLGATLIKTDIYSSEITHLITDAPKRSEKVLCSIAAGHYILHSSYLDESVKSGYFLTEEQFEWGNELAKENLPDLPVETERMIAKAAFRWRLKISNSKIKTGPYEKMKAVIFTKSNKMYENLVRLINCGKGEVLDKKEKLNATHCFIDPKFDEEINVELLASKSIYCLNAVSLVDILVDSQPKYEALICKEYKKYYKF